MFSKTRSLTTILVVITVVTMVSSQESKAQLFKRFIEGGNASSADSRQPNAQNGNRNSPDPRSAAQKNSQAPSTPTTNRNIPDPRQNASGQARGTPRNPLAYPPNGNSNGNGRTSNQPQTQPPRPQPSSGAQGARQLPPNSPAGAAGRPAPSARQLPPSRAVPPNANANAGRYRAAEGLRSDPRNPADSFGGARAPSVPFSNTPLAQPNYKTGPQDPALSRNSSNSRNPNTQSAESDSAIEVSNPVNEREVLSRFGLNLSEEGESVLVSQIDGKGNAAQAGLQRNDMIVSLGGAPIVSQKEFAQIAGLLSNGDQIEIVYTRGGKEEKAFIQYGNSDDPTEVKAEGSAELHLSDSSWEATPQSETQQLQKLVSQQRQVIAELQERVRELEKRQGNTKF